MDKNELTHHGIKGQKWGVRRYQNSDGSLTPAGARRYRAIESSTRKLNEKAQKTSKQASKASKKADRLKNRPAVFRSYKDIGRVSVKALKKEKKLQRIQERISKNEKLMNELVNQIPSATIENGKKLISGI